MDFYTSLGRRWAMAYCLFNFNDMNSIAVTQICLLNLTPLTACRVETIISRIKLDFGLWEQDALKQRVVSSILVSRSRLNTGLRARCFRFSGLQADRFGARTSQMARLGNSPTVSDVFWIK